jgi:hypothetical protein
MLKPIVPRKVKIVFQFTPYIMVIISNFTTTLLHIEIHAQLELLN